MADSVKTRSSNFELYRILCMLMIVAHHYVVNSGLLSVDGPVNTINDFPKDIYLYVFGAWGKTGINCFLLITGYFMCKSDISLRKFVKLLLQIYLFKIIIFVIFLITGYETFTGTRIIKLLMPVWGFKQNFTSCFIGFWLTIPFLNILIRNMTKKQHQYLLLLLLGMFTILGSIPNFDVAVNYVFWFSIIYLVAAYIRFYPAPIFENVKLWGWLTLVVFIISVVSVIVFHNLKRSEYCLLSDSNKIFAVVFAISSFLWFKNLDIKYSKLINIIGGSTFGVLLIHANSNAMRTWLWKDFIDCAGHYQLPLIQLMGYSMGCILAIFIICIIIDRLRIKLIEEPFFKWFDKFNINLFQNVK